MAVENLLVDNSSEKTGEPGKIILI